MKKQRGITLIALIITVILMLILAGTVISLTIGEKGNLNMAKKAGRDYEIASIKEQIITDILAKQAENQGDISDDSLKEILESYGILSDEEQLIDKTLTTTKGDYKIKVSDIFNGTTVKDVPKEPVIADKSGANTPSLNKIAQKTYVTWELNKEGTEYVINDRQTTQPENWYDYENGKWANIKTTKVNTNSDGTTETLEAYWVWIPRYEYVVPTSTTETQIDVRFIGTDKKEGTEGYTKQTDGTIKSSDGYTIHPAFTNSGNGGLGELDGLWVAKFEAVNNNSKVEVVPNKASWRSINTNNIFKACRRMTELGEVLEGSTVDSHMMKNTEWGAVAILSQSKYGVYNLQSSTGENGDKTYQVWNNPSNSYITGSVGNNKDDKKQTDVNAYNSANGPKASTTGTVYGVFDMAGGSLEYVAGCLNGQENSKFGVETENSKYVDLYTNPGGYITNYEGAKIGDATKETKGWNDDESKFVCPSSPVFVRGR